jgi:hypothetical protein
VLLVFVLIGVVGDTVIAGDCVVVVVVGGTLLIYCSGVG